MVPVTIRMMLEDTLLDHKEVILTKEEDIILVMKMAGNRTGTNIKYQEARKARRERQIVATRQQTSLANFREIMESLLRYNGTNQQKQASRFFFNYACHRRITRHKPKAIVLPLFLYLARRYSGCIEVREADEYIECIYMRRQSD
mmetsp:Transcript_15235/g.22497  ORF Transcript_15235/g.22497 Transcript_15235/m.22497 type:complete len:145 (+) Transcript_15235:879-1313(+)